MKKQHFKLSLIGGMLLAMSATVNAQWTETGSAVYLTNGNKNVGIGTATPAFALDLIRSGSANLSLKSTTGTSNLLLDRANSAATSSVSYRTNGVGTWQTGTVGTNNFNIRNIALGNTAMSISATNNNVGLGVNTPFIILDTKEGQTIGTTATTGTQHAAGNQGEKVSFGYMPSNALTEFVGMKAVVNPGTNFCGNSGDILFNTWECNTSISRPVMAINGNGNVGIGTTSPAAKLEVNGGALFKGGNLVLDNISQRLFENGSPTWDIFGGSSNYAISRSGIDYPFVIDYATGNVGIGTTTPVAKLEVNGGALFNGGFVKMCTSPDNTLGNISIGTSSSFGNGKVAIFGNQSYGLYLSSPLSSGLGGAALFVDGDAAKNTGGSSWIVASDARLKENINSYTDGLNELMKINPVKYHYTAASGMDASREYIGVLAQQLKEVAPYMVGKFKNFKDNQEYYNVDNSAMTYMLINAIKELNTKLEDVQAENTNLKSCVESLCNNAATSKVGTAEINNNQLFQNSPNPFNQTTVIRYALNSENTSGKIIIRDLSGNLVKQVNIANGGKGQVTINANELSTGTYTYTLEIAGASVDTKLMVVTK